LTEYSPAAVAIYDTVKEPSAFGTVSIDARIVVETTGRIVALTDLANSKVKSLDVLFKIPYKSRANKLKLEDTPAVSETKRSVRLNTQKKRFSKLLTK
jgi:hypothetical protein